MISQLISKIRGPSRFANAKTGFYNSWQGDNLVIETLSRKIELINQLNFFSTQ
jgi:hypothetical protein